MDTNKERVDRYYHLLLDRLDVSDVFLGSLHQDGVLDYGKMEELRNEKLTRTCRQNFLDWIRTEDEKTFESFFKALSVSEQEDLKKELQESSGSSLEKEREKIEWQIKIRKCHTDLVRRLLCRADFLSHFVSKNVLRDEDQSLIEIGNTETQKSAKFLSILHHKGPEAFRLLIEVLRSDTGIADLAEKIVNTQVTEDDWNQYYDERERKQVEDMLLMGFQFQSGATVLLKDVMKHLEIRYRKVGERLDLDSSCLKKHLQRTFNGVKVDEITAAERNKKKRLLVHNLTATSGCETEMVQQESSDEHGGPESMGEWSSDKVVNWLKDVTDGHTIAAIERHGMRGEQLVSITLEDLEKIIPKKKAARLIEDRDEYVESKKASLQGETAENTSERDFKQSTLAESFQPFGRNVDITDSYQQYSCFPPVSIRPTNLIDPVRRFVHLDTIEAHGTIFKTFANEVVTFGAACLNDCTNGVIHFGVNDLKILGVAVRCPKLWLDKSLTQEIKKSFHESQVDRVLKCIRPIKWVPVRCEDAYERYVIEVEVEPASDLCGEDVFLVHSSKDLYRFEDHGPGLVKKEKYIRIIQDRSGLTNLRREREYRKQVLKPTDAHRDKLVNLLCRGKSKFREGDCFILALPPADSKFDSASIEEKFSFLQQIKWKAVFDFGADRKFLDYINKQDRLFKIRDIKDFDLESGDALSVKNTKEDAYNGHVPYWILMNGDINRPNCPPRALIQWKQNVEDAFRACSKTYTKSRRVFIVFLLHSANSDVYIDACAQLCLQTDSYACIAESIAVSKTWQAGIMKHEYVKNATDLSNRVIAGLPWTFVSEIVNELTHNELQTNCKVPTSIGDQVLKIKRELCDLQVLASNECEDNSITKDSQKLEAFLKSKEAEFYKGGKPCWWNFWSEGVCTRDIISSLENKVRTALFEEGIQGEIAEGIKTRYLYHQPGAGGTTCARHVLWNFRKEVKCTEIAYFTENTCAQIAKLRDFGEPMSQDPGPLLLLIDNANIDKVYEFLMMLRKQAQTRDRNVAKTNAYCVCLIVESRSNLPKEVASKHDPFECLSQRLSPREETLFQKQSERLQEKKHASHTLIAFNIMKTNFDAQFITTTVASLIKGVTKATERFILKYLAFFNFYDVCQGYVEAAAFDEVMEQSHWLDDLSNALNVLISHETNELNQHLCLKISHPLLAKEILKELRTEKLSEFTKELLDHRLVRGGYSQATINLRRLLAGMVKQRALKKYGLKEQFSPLIMQIREEESWKEAAIVLEMVYHLTKDPFVAQHLARLYIDSESWESAAEYATAATSQNPDNSHLWNTKGQVYRHKLEKNCESISRSADRTLVTPSKALRLVEEAYEATKIFKKVQEMYHSVSAKSETFKPSISGQLGTLQIYAAILENLTLMPLFATKGAKKSCRTLQRFLNEAEFVPAEIRSWQEGSTDYINYLKGIPEDAKETLRYVEDFQHHLNKSFAKSQDFDYDLEISRTMASIKSVRKRLFKFILNKDETLSRESLPNRKNDIWLLGGTSFNNILEQLSFHGKPDTQGRGSNPEDIAHLQQLLDHARECLRDDSDHYEAIECFIGTSLMISCYFSDTDLMSQVGYEEVLLWSKKLYAIRSRKQSRVEPYMYYVMFHWPKTQDFEGQKAISDAIATWRDVFSRKHPNSTAWHAFYFAKGEGLKSFIDRSQWHGTKASRGDAFWKDDAVARKLKRFTGILNENGNFVFLQDDEARRSILKLSTSYPIHDSNLWNSRVSFVVAFTFMGPKACDVQRE